ncbi:MAG TPA: YbjQ family protein, partial [Herpetosiphonaceae bacterium]|nr:YbjQ family protein [Herpetosiphonaceae bacterium]
TGPTQRLAKTDEPADQIKPVEQGEQPMVDLAMVSSTLTLPGFRIVRSLGIVRGLVVRSASVGGQIASAFQALRGGNIRVMTGVCEHARTDAFLMILAHAAQLGANGIVGFAYDTTEIATGMTEVLAYGTAVLVEPEAGI